MGARFNPRKRSMMSPSPASALGSGFQSFGELRITLNDLELLRDIEVWPALERILPVGRDAMVQTAFDSQHEHTILMYIRRAMLRRNFLDRIISQFQCRTFSLSGFCFAVPQLSALNPQQAAVPFRGPVIRHRFVEARGPARMDFFLAKVGAHSRNTPADIRMKIFEELLGAISTTDLR
jgi:hypothetical protein